MLLDNCGLQVHLPTEAVKTACAGAQGHFAVNLWFKSNNSIFSGNAYANLLSAFENATLQNDEGSNVYVPNSLQLMLPEVGTAFAC